MKSKTKTTLREMLSIELLNLCAETNKAQLGDGNSEPRFSKEKVDSLKKLAIAVYGDSNYGTRLMQWAAVLLDAPELNTGALDRFNLFSVIAFKLDRTTHKQKIGKPFIVCHTDSRTFLMDDGNIGNKTFNHTDEPYLVGDDQILECINNLTDAQWKTIATNPIFAPLTQALLDREIQLVEPEEPKVKKAKKVEAALVAPPELEPAF